MQQLFLENSKCKKSRMNLFMNDVDARWTSKEGQFFFLRLQFDRCHHHPKWGQITRGSSNKNNEHNRFEEGFHRTNWQCFLDFENIHLTLCVCVFAFKYVWEIDANCQLVNVYWDSCPIYHIFLWLFPFSWHAQEWLSFISFVSFVCLGNRIRLLVFAQTFFFGFFFSIFVDFISTALQPRKKEWLQYIFAK